MGRRDLSIAVVGAGFSGIGLAIGLKQAGFTDLTIFDKADGVGGVWRDNTYPGAACDAPSYLYSYSFEPKPDWTRRFAEQPEILDYLRHCTAAYGLTPHLRLGIEIIDAEFDAARGRWRVRTGDGEHLEYDLLVAACGQLSNPAVPRLPGMDSFGGTMFHSARWDHDHDLTGARVAVVGNGASAIQFVPLIASDAESLTVFQLEVHWISRKPDRVYPRWRHALNRRVPAVQKLSRLGIFLWFELVLNPSLVSPRGRRLLSAPVRALCRYALRSVRDPKLRDRLTPRYEPGCKRILTSSEYYETLNRPNVGVIDSPITELTPDGVRTADGEHHLADTVIWATGFRSQDFVAPMRVTGPHGTELNDAWKDGARAYLGLAVPGFPNFFLMYGPNTNVGSGSIVHMLESQIAYIVQAAHLLARGVTSMDVREDVLDRFDAAAQRRLSASVWNQGGCDSWYLDADRRNTNNWPGFMTGYRRRTRRLNPSDYHLQH
ncbi:Predicted flavoprotein CzcO associated with the cation diffusion facilitator CzcD [Thermomonospora echinospora]|uniref:Predicted flavoprotein CzcO associated with the cation diffusion facilitator CzcD n=1 Tax=Thermomonospora echinospora TaxID=1992 RepID=A0A1H5X9L2_9ACTN|nr:NAD(P)/FAD-dependent oxidoreductase [Thermomonospora echinospora]SEG08429.1 Predicted flavoprotein CzcO associated with the cation diffusion facilitator CzcD [Thermomonospora echinospora]